MPPIIYDVAVSIDGYIPRPDGGISKFAQEGPVVSDYTARLATYSVAIMGRATYEFGYRFGLKPGQNPYAHMKTFVFSRSIDLPADRDVTIYPVDDASTLEVVSALAEGPIYLCGGGAFAGSWLELGLIDRIRLKRAPIILGNDVKLFGVSATSPTLSLVDTRSYRDGYIYQEFLVL